MRLRARRIAHELAETRASERRFRDLTELSADWFWETDASHRITWLSGDITLAALFGGTPAYGRRLWEIPGVHVDPRMLDALLQRLAQRQPFFDLEMAREDERGARHVHMISGQC